MKRFPLFYLIGILILLTSWSCVVKKKKREASAFGKFYHNTTAYYNGYWNAKEIYKESMKLLKLSNIDDYSNILEVEDYVSVNNPKMVKQDMDKIIEKVSTVAQLHEPSKWVDDCYVMMAKAQYLKQEYETAEETLEYFQEDFNPGNPYGRNYKNKKLTGKAAKKAKAAAKKEKEEEKKKEKKEKEKIKEEKAKTKEEERKEKEKEKKRIKKEKEEERKVRAKNRKKGIKTPPPTKTTTPNTDKSTDVDNKKPTTNESTLPKEEVFKPVKPIKPQIDKTAYSEGMLWLAKVYIKRENWFASEIILEKLASSPVNDAIKGALPSTFAQLFIKQERYDEALIQLDEAIEKEDDKQLRARYAFIAGQIYQKRNDFSGALKYFNKSKKLARDPKMEFMAELAIAKNGLISGERSKESIMKALQKMLKEDKNAQLKDQIYFTMAEIELSQKNIDQAITYFINSNTNNNGDQKLKSESYYRIANLYYTQEKYLEATNYFDTTLSVLNKTDDRYSQVQRYVNSLKDIAANIETINYQDSLLYFSSLSEEEQKKQAIKWFAKTKKPKQAESTKASNMDNVSVNTVSFGTSNFFAYNKLGKEKGKEQFSKTWVGRTLEDNWRRSAKAATNDNDEAEADKNENIAEKQKNEEDEIFKSFLKELPTTPAKKQATNTVILDAMFTLGKLFRDKIDNYAKSIEVLEKMNTRFGSTQYELDAFFYLYLNYLDLNNISKADEYKNKLINKYPDSKYASILLDPEFVSKEKKKLTKAEQYYKIVYAFFEKNEYEKALEAIKNSKQAIGDDQTYDAKMALIKAMCIGNKEGKDAYVKAINEVISSYPNTPEQTKAKEIMRFLGGDKAAFSAVQDVDKKYDREENSLHYIAILTYNLEESQHINFKVAISEFGKKNFKLERLQMGDVTLNIEEKIEVILIRKFENEKKAFEYYKKAMENKEEFTGNVQATYDVLVVSSNNYRKMISERSSVNYRSYFETVLLPEYK